RRGYGRPRIAVVRRALDGVRRIGPAPPGGVRDLVNRPLSVRRGRLVRHGDRFTGHHDLGQPARGRHGTPLQGRGRGDRAVAGELDRDLDDPGRLGAHLERLDLDGLPYPRRAVPEHADVDLLVVGERVPNRLLARVRGLVGARQRPAAILQPVDALGPILPELRHLLEVAQVRLVDRVEPADLRPGRPVGRYLDLDLTPLHR